MQPDHSPESPTPAAGAGASTFRLTLLAEHKAHLTAVETWRSYLATLDLSPKAVYAAELAFEELVSNGVKYAYPESCSPAGRRIEILAQLAPGSLRITFIDFGVPFDPTTYEPQPLADDLSTAAIGGLGLQMVRDAVAAMSYERRDGRNETVVRVSAP